MISPGSRADKAFHFGALRSTGSPFIGRNTCVKTQPTTVNGMREGSQKKLFLGTSKERVQKETTTPVLCYHGYHGQNSPHKKYIISTQK